MLHTTVIYARKLAKRHQLFGQIVRFGIPAIWFTINPSDLIASVNSDPIVDQVWWGVGPTKRAKPKQTTDLKNPVVLRVDIHPHMDRSELNRLRRLHAIGNPTIVAQYFHFVVDSFFKKLLCTDSGKVGILGEISNHFAVVEENNRHMLHLHGFAWVTGNMNLQNRVLADTEFRKTTFPCRFGLRS